MRVRGEYCIGSASFLAFVAVVLLVFSHVAQNNTSTVPRALAMVTVDITAFGPALQRALGQELPGLYNKTPSATLGEEFGLRSIYKWGMYSYCGYSENPPVLGTCTKTAFARPFEPYDAIHSDASDFYSIHINNFIPDIVFKNSAYLASLSRAGFYFIFIGTVFTLIALFTGLFKSNPTFFMAAFSAIIGTLCLLIGAAIWTAMLLRTRTVNSATISVPSNGTTGGTTQISLGIEVTMGSGLWLQWAAFTVMFLSMFPYVMSCWSYRLRKRRK